MESADREEVDETFRSGWAGVVSAGVVAALGRWTLVPRSPIEDKFLATKLEFLSIGFGRGRLDILFVYLFVLLALLPVVLRYRKPEPFPSPERSAQIREP